MDITATGARYMIVDIGGGTADIIVHEKEENGSLKEVHSASGGPWGGIEVDKSFIQLLANIVGNDVMKKFRQENMADYLDLLRDFEVKKRSISGETNGKIVIKIPISLKEMYDESGSTTIADAQKKFDNKFEWKGDKMRFHADLLKGCFKFSVQQLIMHIRGILLERKMQGVNQIMLVGGFAECALVQEAFKEHFKDKKLIVPEDCGTVVLKGAVLYGHNLCSVSSRVSRYTYGLQLAVPFVEGIHPEENKRDSIDGKFCTDTFWKIVEIGQDLQLGHTVTRKGRPIYYDEDGPSTGSCVTYEIYKSTKSSPILVTDEGCESMGLTMIPLPPVNDHRLNTFDQIFTFGDTELKYSTRHHITNEVTEVYLEM